MARPEINFRLPREPKLEHLVACINRKKWWHVLPASASAYKKRGKFFASTFKEAEFYGRPLDNPERVNIASPFVCDNRSIEKELLGRIVSRDGISYEEIVEIDAKLRKAALERGYDSIVLFSEKAFQQFRESGKVPRSIELNVLNM
jgi:hypothetical protein